MKVNFNGRNIYYNQVGEGSPLFILHGGPALSHEYLFNHLLPLSKFFQLTLIDFSSHGQSDDTDSLAIEDMADEVEAIRSHLQLNRIALLGHSMGGFAAQQYARKYNNYLSHLILVSTAASSPNAVNKVFKAISINAKINLIGKIISHLPNLIRGRNAGMMRSYFTIGSRSYVKYERNLEQFIQSYTGAIKKDCKAANSIMKSFSKINFLSSPITTHYPTLILCGDNDVIMGDLQENLKETYPNATFKWLDAGHDPFLEDPSNFIRSVIDFLLHTRDMVPVSHLNGDTSDKVQHIPYKRVGL